MAADDSQRSKVKRKCLTLETKIEIIKLVDSNVKKSEIAAKFDIPKSSLSTILKYRDKFLQEYYENNGKITSKKLRKASFEDVEEAVMLWFSETRNKNIPVSGLMLQEKAKEFAENLGCANFKASSGWVHRFKSRHDISSKLLLGESASVDGQLIQDWRHRQMDIIKNFEPFNIFNMDESALFYRLLPSRTLTLNNEPCKGGKLSKEKLSVLFAANMDGTEKLRLLVIGKSKNPRCFKGLRSLPVDYESNTKAWMTSKLFNNWLLKLNAAMMKSQRKILMLLDNCSAHTSSIKLTNIKLLFLPPNATSVIQPLDQGIIRSVKCAYRKQLVQRLIFNIDHKIDTKIDVKMAIDMIVLAWDSVSKQCIVNCFKKAGFMTESTGTTVDENFGEFYDDFQMLWEKIKISDQSIDDYIDIDNDVECTSQITDEDICASIKDKDANSEEESDQEINVNQSSKPIISFPIALDYLEEITRFVNSHENTPDNIICSLIRLQNHIVTEGCKTILKQSKITDFFGSTSAYDIENICDNTCDIQDICDNASDTQDICDKSSDTQDVCDFIDE